MVLFLPATQATNMTFQKNENMFADAMSLDDLFLSYGAQSMNKEPFVCSDEDGIHVDTLPLYPTNIDRESMTKEEKDELYRLMCVPGYFTPNQVTIQADLDEGGQRAGGYGVVNTVLVLDEEATYNVFGQLQYPFATWIGCCIIADNILEGGDDYLEVPYGIDFQTNWNYICFWNSPNDKNYHELLAEISKVDPTGVGCDVIVLMSGQYGGASSTGGSIIGAANATSSRHFVMDVDVSQRYWYSGDTPPVANLFQHEASHLFDCSDHVYDYTYCIMNYRYDQEYRGYCNGCDTQLWLNRFRFPF